MSEMHAFERQEKTTTYYITEFSKFYCKGLAFKQTEHPNAFLAQSTLPQALFPLI